MKGNEVDLRRRRAFKQFVGTLLVSAEEIRGHRHCAFSELETLDREKFEKLIPAINKEFQLAVVKGVLMARNRKTKEKIPLFEPGIENTTAFNQMNGKNSVEKIAQIFCSEMHCGDEEGFVYVKNLLLNLLRAQVCIFTNPLEY